MDYLRIIRFVLFGFVLLFSLVELGLCAKDIHVTKNGVFIDDGSEILFLSPFFFPFAAFGLAISVLSLLFMIPIIAIDLIRKNPGSSVIAFELIWTGILWVLWLAVAADATAPGIFKNCDYEDDRLATICHQFVAIQGLAFFNWLLLIGWWITLGIIAFRLRKKSNNANLWRQSVADARMSLNMARLEEPIAQGSRGGAMMNILKGRTKPSKLEEHAQDVKVAGGNQNTSDTYYGVSQV